MQCKDDIAIFAGNASRELTAKICEYLNMPQGGAQIKQFSDGETQIEIVENIRLKDVFIVQSTCRPVNESVMELLLMLNACVLSSVKRVTAVIPYFGYARQDKKVAPRAPISARLVADLLEAAGADRIITMDLHAGQIQGFFNIPVDHLFAAPVTVQYIRDNFNENLVIVSPDAGGAERARAIAKRLGADLAIIDKRRSAPNVARAMHVIGDVKDKITVIVDDMVDTAGTLTQGAAALAEHGAAAVHACCSHAVLSGPAMERIESSPLNSLIVTDSIPLNKEAAASDKLTVLTTAELFGEAIIRSHTGDSVTSLFV